jgi:hypothetical protein
VTYHDDLWSQLGSQGYAITSDQAIWPPGSRTAFHGTYFTDRILRHDDGDMPADRQRARDVIRYQWHDRRLTLIRHHTIAIPGQHEHVRVELLDDPQARDLIRALLHLVPPQRRQASGTFGVNLFRTFTNVVTAPHRDNQQFIIIYVLDRIGEGAETYLYRTAGVTDDGEIVLRQQLNPGDIIIFEDALFKHGATPLISPLGSTARRDALICTVDWASTI